jgi:deoxyribose-phosphate aldolase
MNTSASSQMDIASVIEHTLLKSDADRGGIEQLCREARQFGFRCVCVNPCWVSTAKGFLQGTETKVCCVVGFPLGAHLPEAKAFEAQAAVRDGAGELDMVINIGALKSGAEDLVLKDMASIASVACENRALSKVILETCLLTEDEKVRACQLAIKAGMDFVKTSTGFSKGGATVEDVALMSRLVRDAGLGVKASGGIRSLADLQALVAAGATRIGTSNGVRIMQEAADLRR